MPLSGRAAALRGAAEAGLLVLEALRTAAPPPWDYDALQTLRSRHPAARIVLASAGDVQTQEAAVLVGGTATLQHPLGSDGPEPAAAALVVSYYGGEATLYAVLPISPVAVTTPDAPTVAVPVIVWDCYPGG